MPKILIPTPLRQYTGKQDTVQVKGGTVGEALTALTAQHHDLRRNLYNDEGKLRSFVNVYLNDEDIRYLSKEATPVKESDTISIVPSIAGGSALETMAPAPTLSKSEILRYSRHLIMPEVGLDGQLKLKSAKVLLIGTGGLGAPLGLYLAAAGVGRIGLVDFDVVVDGTDNFPTRYLVNDACVLLGKPNVYGSIFRFEGQATVFAYQGGPCYRCLYPEPPPPGLVPSCAEGGVLGILPGTIGLIQATETVKLILGKGELLVGRLLLYDALGMRFRELKLRKNPECPICGDHRTITQLIDYNQFCGIPAHEPAPAPGLAEGEIDPVEVKAKIDRGDPFVLIDVREPHEYQIAKIPYARLIPLGELPKRVNELNSADEIVAHCKSGMRSAKAVEFLKQAGFKKVKNMKGGILAWSDKVDPKVPKY